MTQATTKLAIKSKLITIFAQRRNLKSPFGTMNKRQFAIGLCSLNIVRALKGSGHALKIISFRGIIQ